jgi:hypothetical protein
MNDNFGSISSDFLPPGYGDLPGKVQHRVDADPATMEPLAEEEYGKLFGEGGKISGLFSKKDDSGSSTSTGSTTVSSESVTTSTTLPPPDYRDVNGTGTWVYRQFASGKIEILPGSKKNVGKTYSSGDAWRAITADIEKLYGPYPEGETVTTTGGGSGGLDSFLVGLGLAPTTAAAGVSTATSSSRGANVGAGIGAAAAQLLPALAAMLGPQDVTVYDEEADAGTDSGSSAGVPWGLVLGGLAVVGSIVGVIYFATRDSDDEE